MSTKAESSDIKAAEKHLAGLHAKRKQLQDAIAGFSNDLSAADFADVSKAISKIAMLKNSIDAAQQAIDLLNPQIEQSEQVLAGLRRRERETQATTLREQEEAAYRLIVSKVQEMSQALDELASIHKELWSKYNLNARKGVSRRLGEVVKGYINHLTQFDPEALGLPPKPTPEQTRRREAEELVKRTRANVELLKERKKAPYGWLAVDEHRLEDAEESLKLAQQKLASLT